MGTGLFAHAATFRECRSIHRHSDIRFDPGLSIAPTAQRQVMMTIPVTVGKSEIHGTGVFAAHDIRNGQVLWMFTPGLDRTISDFAMEYAEPRVRQFIFERGYLNLDRKQWVICIDEAQFWNFPAKGESANSMMGNELDGEKLVIAARDIKAGEELTIPPESDGDYERKVKDRR